MTILITPELHDKLVAVVAKRTAFQQFSSTISALAVGSSHGEAGFNPDFIENSFNLCSSSQDLKYSYLLYEKAVDACPRLKNIIVFYSIFSSASILERSPSEKEWSVALNEVFHLGVTYEDPHLKGLSETLNHKIDDARIEGPLKGFPPIKMGCVPDSYGASNRVRDHLRYNQKDDAIGYLYSMAALAKNKDHKLIIVIPPVRSDYRAAAGNVAQFLFKNLYRFADSLKSFYEPVVVDLYSEGRFADQFFVDFDHLNPFEEGPRLMAAEIVPHLLG